MLSLSLLWILEFLDEEGTEDFGLDDSAALEWGRFPVLFLGEGW